MDPFKYIGFQVERPSDGQRMRENLLAEVISDADELPPRMGDPHCWMIPPNSGVIRIPRAYIKSMAYRDLTEANLLVLLEMISKRITRNRRYRRMCARVPKRGRHRNYRSWA